MRKKTLSLILSLVMCLGLTAPAFATEAASKKVELREGITLTGVVEEEIQPNSPVDIMLYKVAFPVTLEINGCGKLDEYGYAVRASMSVEIWEASQNGPDEPADWDWDQEPYIPGQWVWGNQIADLKWTENDTYTFDSTFAGKTVVLSADEQWESTGKDGGGNGIPSSGSRDILVHFVADAATTQPERPTDFDPAYQVSDWAAERVALAVETGLAPEDLGDDYRVNITRAQFAATAVKLYEAMSGETVEATGESSFTDTTDPVILQAADMGFVSGVGDGKFSPDALVTREQAAVMLSSVYTKLGGEIPTVETTTFADDDDVSGWARNAVAFMNSKEIVTGVGDNNFAPQGNASIEQALLISLKMFETLQ